jgi:hypothetical protein
VPLPVPLEPDVIVIHDGAGTLLTAVHGQSSPEAVTVFVPEPPKPLNAALLESIKKVQPEA